MKAKFTFLGLLICSVLCAQDVIVTNDSQRIDSKIEEVSSEYVKYRKTSNLTGPLFVTSTSEIQLIVYENGEVQMFNQAKKEMPNQELKDSAEESADPKPSKSFASLVSRKGNRYIVDDREMGQLDFLNWLSEQQCWSAYNQFKKGRNLAVGGWITMGCGFAEILGMTLLSKRMQRSNKSTIQIGMTVFGGCLIVASIPTIAVGYKKMHNAVTIYNVECGKKTMSSRPYWGVQLSENGIGIAYNF
jgi:hypothetical protein